MVGFKMDKAQLYEQAVRVLSGALEGISELPCRVDEMTERELKIFNYLASLMGAAQFIIDQYNTAEESAEQKKMQKEVESLCEVVCWLAKVATDQAESRRVAMSLPPVEALEHIKLRFPTIQGFQLQNEVCFLGQNWKEDNELMGEGFRLAKKLKGLS